MTDVRVNLPPGCYGLKIGPKEFNGKRGGHAMVPEEYAKLIPRSSNGQLDIISARQPVGGSEHKGRRCLSCGFLGYQWMHTCSRCHSDETEAE